MPTITSSYRAVVCHEYGQSLQVVTRNVPEALPGTAIVKILAAVVNPRRKSDCYLTNAIFTSVNNLLLLLEALLWEELRHWARMQPASNFIRGRDDSTAQIIRGVYKGPTPSAKTLSHQPNLWRDGFWTEYSHTPLENCYHLDENDLLGKPEHGGLGYGIGDLAYMNKLALAYGGFRSIGLRTGQTIIITPATGNHGGAAVQVASAMGARVIAVGRNINSLKELQQKIPRVFPVQLTGELKDDLKILSPFGTIDAFLDFTPSSMTYPLHLKSCLAAVKSYGQGLLMGFPRGDYSLLYGMMIGKNINIRAQYMYERDDVRGLIKLVEMGILRVGNASGAKVVNFTLDQYDEAISQAAEQQTWGLQVVLRPFRE